jgi:hypothetical protein
MRRSFMDLTSPSQPSEEHLVPNAGVESRLCPADKVRGRHERETDIFHIDAELTDGDILRRVKLPVVGGNVQVVDGAVGTTHPGEARRQRSHHAVCGDDLAGAAG